MGREDYVAIIQTFGRGGENVALLEMRIHELADEFGDQIEFRVRIQEAYVPPELEVLLITIIGGVAAHVVTKLIDKLFEKKEDAKNVTIQIIHQDFGVVFNLPGDNEKCAEHFRRLEKDSDPNSSAEG